MLRAASATATETRREALARQVPSSKQGTPQGEEGLVQSEWPIKLRRCAEPGQARLGRCCLERAQNIEKAC